MTCGSGKTEFTSRRRAKAALHALRRPHGRMHVYRCGGHWHIGHNDRLDRARWRK